MPSRRPATTVPSTRERSSTAASLERRSADMSPSDPAMVATFSHAWAPTAGHHRPRRGPPREDLVPRRQVRAVEAEPSPPDHPHEDDLDRERRRYRHEPQVAEVDVAPRGDHVEHDRERGHGHDRPGERPPRPAEPL